VARTSRPAGAVTAGSDGLSLAFAPPALTTTEARVWGGSFFPAKPTPPSRSRPGHRRPPVPPVPDPVPV